MCWYSTRDTEFQKPFLSQHCLSEDCLPDLVNRGIITWSTCIIFKHLQLIWYIVREVSDKTQVNTTRLINFVSAIFSKVEGEVRFDS